MKQHSILWMVMALFAFSCSQKETINTKVIIAGKLENTEAKEIKLYLEDEIASSSIEEDGSFYLNFDTEETETYILVANRERVDLFLSPGDSVYLAADSKDFKTTLGFQGDHIMENKYLFDKHKFYAESGMDNMMELMKLDQDNYFQKKNAFFDEQKGKLEKLKAENELHPNFVKVQQAYFDYEPLLLDLQYPMYHAYVNKISPDSVDFPIEEAKAALKKVDLNRKDLLASRSYTSLIDRIISDEAGELIKQDTTIKKDQNGYEKARLMAIDKLLKDPAVKDQIFYNTIKPNLDYRGPLNVKASYDKFMAENQSPKLAAKLKAIHDKWEPIMPGKEVPDFTFSDIEGETVKLSDLKGTLVYVDIWATWCGPCIAEHPHWDKMKEEYEDKPVSFLTISIDNSKEPWEKMVKAKKMDGLQWFAENAWQSELAQHFNVNGIPRFLLLDQEGKIIDPSADRPSGDIRTTIDKYL